MKIFKRTLLIIFLLIILVYATNITSIPDSVVIFQGENLNLRTVLGIYIQENIEYEAIQTSGKISNENKLQTSTVNVKLFNMFNIKQVEVNTIPKTTVIPLGNSIGLKLYTNGVLVVGMTEVNGKKPYEESRNRRRRCNC